MLNHIAIFLGCIFLLACNNPSQNQNENSKQSDLKNENLKGKVKSITGYKANIIDIKNEVTEEPIIEFRKEYNDRGMISLQQLYDTFGKLKHETTNEYNNEGLRIKTVRNSFHPETKSVELIRYDTTGKPVSISVIINDTNTFVSELKYNEFGDLAQSIITEDGKTDTTTLKYKYNDDGQINWKKQTQSTDQVEYKYITTYKYDNNGNLIEETSHSDLGKMKWTYQYNKNNNLIASSTYQDADIQQKTKYNKNRNYTLIQLYDQEELYRELKYEYDLDKKGNWIEKKVFVKQISSDDNKFTPAYIQTRKIEYYE